MNKIQNMRERVAKHQAKSELGVSGQDNTVRQYMLTKHIDFGNGKEVTLDMVSELDIDLTDIDNEMKKQAASFGFMSVCYEVASKRADTLKNELEELRATKYFELKNGEFEQRYPGVRVTEDALKHATTVDSEVKESLEKHRSAHHDAQILLSYRIALSQKKDMLQSINSSMNREYRGSVS